MPDRLSQPSPFVFPVALEPDIYQTDHVATRRSPWGWLELFVVSQVFWGVLLFIPGSQAFRIYIRAFPYVTSLAALLSCARSTGTDTNVPGARWIIAVVLLLAANLVHDETWFAAGVAQEAFQLAIAAPVFWTSRAWITDRRLERLLLLVFGANFASAVLGLLQVYYPATFLPPEFSSLAFKLNAEFLGGLSYLGSEDRVIIRPPGLSDLPGGAAISGTIAALLGFAFALRRGQLQVWKALFFGAAAIGITVVYLTQVRSMLLMLLGCMLAIALVRLRQGRLLQSSWVVASAAALIAGSFVWAGAVGGEALEDLYRCIVDSGLLRTYQENRGFFLSHTIYELPFQYPLGAGLGRWGMMSAYFAEPENWRHPSLYAELQLTGWLYDGGVLMWVLYPMALFLAMRYSYRRAIDPTGTLNDSATTVLAIQLLLVGLCFTGPVFNTQVGMMFWLTTAMLYGAERTGAIEAWQAESEAWQPEDDAQNAEDDGVDHWA
jgi:hypothetical protein